MNIYDSDYNSIQMRFIYKALLNGWTVKYNGDETFEFKKKKNKFTKNVNWNEDIQRILLETTKQNITENIISTNNEKKKIGKKKKI
jgi:hypothetical protein